MGLYLGQIKSDFLSGERINPAGPVPSNL